MVRKIYQFDVVSFRVASMVLFDFRPGVDRNSGTCYFLYIVMWPRDDSKVRLH